MPMPTAPKPGDYDAYLEGVFGEDLPKFMTHPPLSEFVRVNTMRASRAQVEDVLARYGFVTEPVPGLDDALKIVEMPYDPTLTIHHFAGWFVKQSLSSQLPVRFLDAQPGQTVIDLCAAPGSKTTQIACAMRNSGCLYANDLAGKRMTPLAARLDAACVAHAALVNRAAERLTQIFPTKFDRVLADVPCSGLGNRFALEENRVRFDRAKTLAGMTQLQYRIALAGCKLLKTGGRMVYSTCSLDPLEDEAVVHEIVTRLPLRLVEVPDIPGIRMRHGLTAFRDRTFDAQLDRARRITPWENDTQGFFFAVLEKTDDLPLRFAHEDPGASRQPTLSADSPEVRPVLENIEHYYGVSPEHFQNYRFIFGSRAIQCLDAHWESVETDVQRAGLCLAKRRGGIWRLSHAMIQTLSPFITRNRVELTPEQMQEIGETGTVRVKERPETPYPVITFAPLGCLANAYDVTEPGDNGGRIAWKRANIFHCIA